MNRSAVTAVLACLFFIAIFTACSKPLILHLTSNQEKTHFFLDGKEVGVNQRMSTTLEATEKLKKHDLVAKADGYCTELKDTITPPYMDATPVEFTFTEKDKCGVATSISNYHSIVVPPDKLEINNYYALVIGNNNYKDSNFPSLRSAISDAQALASLLENSYGFKVQLLENATHKEIIDSLQRYKTIFSNQNNSDSFLIYYAGHGAEDQSKKEGYWLPVDAELESKSRWIPNSQIVNEVKSLDAKHIFIIADSCYSGDLLRSGLKSFFSRNPFENREISRGLLSDWQPKPGSEEYNYKGYIWDLLRRQSRMALTSGSKEPVVDGCPGIKDGHSCFAHALLEVLRDNSKVLESAALFLGIRKQVASNTKQMPKFGIIYGAGDDGGDFLFVKK